jgi:glutamate dehydrogenase (NAD(P)+)
MFPSVEARVELLLTPHPFTERLELVTRKYAMKVIKKGFIGAAVDCLGPDMGTNEQVMTWIKDTYMNVSGEQDINVRDAALEN